MAAKINQRTTVYRGRVFDLIRENVTLENGAVTDVEFIEHPGAAAIVPLLDDRRVVLLKQYRHSLKKNIWEIPAGTLNSGEQPIDCACRELREETGYAAGNLQALGRITPLPGYSNECIDIFLATELRKAARHLDPDEVIQVQEIDFSRALEMIVQGEIQDAKSIAGLHLAMTRLSRSPHENIS